MGQPSSISAYRTAVSQDGSRVSGFFLQYSAGDNRGAFSMTAADGDNAATTRAPSTAAPTLNAWTHLAGGHPLTPAHAGCAAGYRGRALNLDGTTSAATTAAPVNTSASFSVSTWVNLADISGFHTVASQDGTQGRGFYLRYSRVDNAWAFAMLASDTAGAAATRAVSPFPPKVGDWTHLVGVHDAAAGQQRLYVHGVRVAAVAHTGAWNATGAFAVGRAKWHGAAADFLPGQVEQLRVWSRALSDNDVRALV